METLEDLIIDAINQGIDEGCGPADTASEVFKLISRALCENGVAVESIDLGELEVQTGLGSIHA